MRVISKPLSCLLKALYCLALSPLFLALNVLVIQDLSVSEKKEFPDWDQGVYAEINKRHGEEAAKRMIDVVAVGRGQRLHE